MKPSVARGGGVSAAAVGTGLSADMLRPGGGSTGLLLIRGPRDVLPSMKQTCRSPPPNRALMLVGGSWPWLRQRRRDPSIFSMRLDVLWSETCVPPGSL